MHAIETERTYLRQLSLDDVDDVLRIFSDPEAMEYSPAGSAQDRTAAEGFIRWNVENYQRQGVGAWAVVLKSTGGFIGQAGLIPHETGLEVFYSFVRESWGHGFAAEVAVACRDYGFQKLQAARLISMIHPQNSRAIKVARKLGMKDVGSIQFWGRENRLFEIHRQASPRAPANTSDLTACGVTELGGVQASRMNSHLLELLRGVPAPGIIAVSGFGGSGKSTLAAEIGRLLDAPVVSVDSFIKDRFLADYARWDLIDYERLEREVLAPFSAGIAPVEFGHFDWRANRVTSHRTLPDCPRIVVEGVGLFRPSLQRYCAFTIWVQCPLEEAIRRGKKRDREVYNNPQDENWDGVWRRNDEEYARLYRPEETADAIYDNSAAHA